MAKQENQAAEVIRAEIQEQVKRLTTIANDDVRMLEYLRMRWEDEKEYEDINDYLKAMQKFATEAYMVNKRPWGYRCKVTLKCGMKVRLDTLMYFKAKTIEIETKYMGQVQ